MSKQYEKDELGVRMKKYEYCYRQYMPLGTIKVIRLDMRAGHTFCRNFKRPFDDIFSQAMTKTAISLCEQIPGVRFAYTQSDEISLALNDNYGRDDSFSCFFEGNIEKMISISASIATAAFNKAYALLVYKKYKDKVINAADGTGVNTAEEGFYYIKNIFNAQFDSRVFILPTEMELHNYFLWRQQDATRNSILSVGYANFPQNKMDNKNCEQIQNMLHMIGINWNDFPIKYKRGIIVVREEYTKKTTYTDRNKEVKEIECLRHRWTSEFPIPILSQAIDFIPYLYNTTFVDTKKFYNCTRDIEVNKWLNTDDNKIYYGITLDASLYEYAINHKESIEMEYGIDISNTSLGEKIISIDKSIGTIIVSKSRYNSDCYSINIKRRENFEGQGYISSTQSVYGDDAKEIIFLGDMCTVSFGKYIDDESKVVSMLSPDRVYRRL